MPRKHRKNPEEQPEELDVERLLTGYRRTVTKRGRRFVVQPIGASSALKEYRCPGCQLIIPPGQAHVVAWEEEGLFGSERAVDERRHWHNHCWRIY